MAIGAGVARVARPNKKVIMKTNLLNEEIPYTEIEILDNIPHTHVVLVAFSGGSDSRVLAHVAKNWARVRGVDLRLAAIRTGVQMDGWEASIVSYARWIDLPLEIYTGEGREYYSQYVNEYGWPGNAKHSQIQNRLKGRAFRKMLNAHGKGLVILSGIRRAESARRARLVSPYSKREGVQFANPLFNWSDADVYDYIDNYDIPEAPGKQWDCKCGATTKHADDEWADIEANAPELHEYLTELRPSCAWAWGKFDRGAYDTAQAIEAGQMSIFDDGSLESFPVCVNCWRDKEAQEQSALSDW